MGVYLRRIIDVFVAVEAVDGAITRTRVDFQGCREMLEKATHGRGCLKPNDESLGAPTRNLVQTDSGSS